MAIAPLVAIQQKSAVIIAESTFIEFVNKYGFSKLK